MKTTYGLDCRNWKGFCEDCKASADIWHDSKTIHLVFHVDEPSVRGVCTADGQNVWEDSCVEFFFAPYDDGIYYNIECSCTGKLLMASGTGRNDRCALPPESYALVRRHASLGEEAFGLRLERTSWDLALDIPAAVFARHEVSGLELLDKASGNLYCCGNKLPERHYLSYAPVHTNSPDFHRPEFFEKMIFER